MAAGAAAPPAWPRRPRRPRQPAGAAAPPDTPRTVGKLRRACLPPRREWALCMAGRRGRKRIHVLVVALCFCGSGRGGRGACWGMRARRGISFGTHARHARRQRASAVLSLPSGQPDTMLLSRQHTGRIGDCDKSGSGDAHRDNVVVRPIVGASARCLIHGGARPRHASPRAPRAARRCRSVERGCPCCRH